MGISIPVSPGELIDKLTILSVKMAYVSDADRRLKVTREYALLKQSWDDSIYAQRTEAGIDALWSDLHDVNRRLWHLENSARESDVRKNTELLAGIARCISAENDLRFRLKNTINILLDSDLQEVKQHGNP